MKQKQKLGWLIVFVCCFLTLMISLALMWNQGVYADAAGCAADDLRGGPLWLMFDWLRLILLAGVAVFSAVKLFHRVK